LSEANDPLWYKDAIIYEVRVRSFFDANADGMGDFAGLTSKLDYLEDLGVTAVWVLPFYPSPLRDDGYDISDYMGVHPDVGTLAEFQRFLTEAHRRGLKVITELVLNHTSDQHPWFQRARRASAGSPERAFYVWSDSPDRYKGARIIFKDFEPSNWSWDPVAKAYFWHRFYSHQPDLNFQNPAVHEAVFQIVDFWLGMGVDGLRLDAVPYLYEEDGTSCENLPQTHEFLRRLRAHVDAKYPNRMLLAEANQWPEDAAAYFGQGDECHMNFHFPIMPRMFMAIQMEDRFPIIDILAQTPDPHGTCQWALFLRNHDELTLEMVTDEERDYMYRVYARENEMRLNLGIRRRLAPLVGNDRRKMLLLNALLFSMPGTPVLYYGDEIGMGDNVYLGDRNGVRTPMQWSADRNAGFSRANPQRLILPIIIDPEYHYEAVNVEAQEESPSSVLWFTKRLVALRKRYRAFGRGGIEFLSPSNPRVLAFVRSYEHAGVRETILVVANLSKFVQYVELDMAKWKGMVPVELFGRTPFPFIGDLPYLLTLGEHSFYWFSLEPSHGAEAEARLSAYGPPQLEAPSLDALFEDEGLAQLEEVMPGFLQSRRWFAGRARHVTGTSVVEVVPTGDVRVTLVRVDYADAEPERYLVPLTAVDVGDPRSIFAHVRVAGRTLALVDALDDPQAARRVLAAFTRERAAGGHGVLAPSAFAPIPPADAEGLEPRVISAGHASAAVRFGDQLVLKVYRRIEDGACPEVEMGRVLAPRAPALVASIVGALEYVPSRARSEPATLAVLQRFLPNEGTAWEHALSELRRFYERTRVRRDPPPPVEGLPFVLATQTPPHAILEAMGTYLDVAALIGRRTAELHGALASVDDPAFAPEPYSPFDQRSLYQSLRNLTGRVFRTLREHVTTLPLESREDGRWLLVNEADVMKRFDRLMTDRIHSLRLRTHGDYHLGQLLFTGKDFVIIDFDGGPTRPLPERRRKRSPLRDLAGVVRSFHFAALVALEDTGAVRESDRAALAPWADAWAAWSASAFLRAYLTQPAVAALLPATQTQTGALLDAFVLAKTLTELQVELDASSPHVTIPLRALVRNMMT
jgi:maltose alpha-D-glucosyltransferase / alpha-amylase